MINNEGKVEEFEELLQFNRESLVKSAAILMVLSVFYLGIALLFCFNYLGWFFFVNFFMHAVPGGVGWYAMKKEKYLLLKTYKKILLVDVVLNVIIAIMLLVTFCIVLAFPSKCQDKELEACKTRENFTFLILVVCICCLLIALGSISMLLSFYRRVDQFLDEKPVIKFTPVNVDSSTN
jgi:hypothetical protein